MSLKKWCLKRFSGQSSVNQANLSSISSSSTLSIQVLQEEVLAKGLTERMFIKLCVHEY